MSVIPLQFMNAVVALGECLQNGNMFWIGSGFIVQRSNEDSSAMKTAYIITNKHIIRNKQRLIVRFNSLGDNFVKDYSIILYDSNGDHLFTEHPDLGTDIVAIAIDPSAWLKDKSIWSAFDLDCDTLTLKQMQDGSINEGSLVYALGFPMNLVTIIKAPICRLGCISRITDAFVLNQSKPIFLVDAQTFPGNSGGPIISHPEVFSFSKELQQKCKLIGILSAYIPYRDYLVSQQTGQSVMMREENSGLTVVYPIDRIKEVVDLEWCRKGKHIAPEQQGRETKEVTT